ncbi:hypothetical protein AB0C77_35000, partial [Streptomyces sp. NPDC048629]
MSGSITAERTRAVEGRRAGPLIVTEDVALLDDLLRLCAAAGAEPEVHHAVPEHRPSWDEAPLVLVGDDAAARCSQVWSLDARRAARAEDALRRGDLPRGDVVG